jgi:hypothetical protein
MREIARLEQAAAEAYRRGTTWSEFWQVHAADVAAAEPYDTRRYHKLVRRLVGLVSSGNLDGWEPIPTGLLWGEAWDEDDLANDTATAMST